jgi:hypothetical protein
MFNVLRGEDSEGRFELRGRLRGKGKVVLISRRGYVASVYISTLSPFWSQSSNDSNSYATFHQVDS